MKLSRRERRKLKLEKQRKESQDAQSEFEKRDEQQRQDKDNGPMKGMSKFAIIGVVIGVVVLLGGAYSVYSLTKPGAYDNFAKCLTEKGAVMYGAMDWCKYTQGQRAMFGKSFKFINYFEHQNLPGISKTPTWVYEGEWYENTQSFEKLAAITGCKI
jgi:predicted RecB family nuclease